MLSEENEKTIKDTIEWLNNYIDEDEYSESAEEAQHLVEGLEEIIGNT